MTSSLAYRKNEAAIRRGEAPAKYTRLLPHIPGHRILEIGSAEGVLASLLARVDGGTKQEVTALERNGDRHEAALRLCAEWREHYKFSATPNFLNADIRDRLDLLQDVDTLVAVRVIYYLRTDIDSVFGEIAARVPNVVLCGNANRAERYHAGNPHPGLGEYNFYASAEGMRDLLTRHGYDIVKEIPDGDPIVVGRKDV